MVRERTPRFAVCLFILYLLVFFSSLNANSQTFTEFDVPSFNSQPQEITAGPNGNIWFTEAHGNKIGRITTTGIITEFNIPTAGSWPAGITAGPDGNIWFTETNGNKIGRITIAGVITEFNIPTDGSWPAGITAGPDGNLWFTEAEGNKIGRITTAGVITDFNIPTVQSSPLGITAGPDGNLWFTETNGNKIGRITTAGVITEFDIPTVNSSPYGITAGPDGNLWFTEVWANKIGRITTAGVITEFDIPTAGSWPAGITAGPDGNIWFTETNGNKIGRITTVGVITEFTIPTVNSEPYGITAGPDGKLWFTEYNGNNIGRLNLQIESPIPDVKANNSDGPVTVSRRNPLSITASLICGSFCGENADWWMVANTPMGWYHYEVGDFWEPGLVVTHQGPLFDLPNYEVLNMSGLPTGSYTFYFGVDMNMNGNLDMDEVYYDSVNVMVGTASFISDIAVNRIGWEATTLNGYTTIPADQVGILYFPEATLGFSINETIAFTISNGTFQDTTFNLCGVVGGVANTDIGDLIAGGTGQNFALFRFTTATDPGAPIAIANNAVCTPSNYISTIRSNPGLPPNTAVTASVTDARTVAGNVQITQALTSGSNVGELLFVAEQFTMTNVFPDTAVITLASNLREFFPDPPSTTATTSNTAFSFVNNYSAAWLGSPESFVADADAASQTITVTNVPSAVSGITYDLAPCTFAGGSTWTCTGPAANDTAGEILDPALGGVRPHLISITVDGVTPIDAATINSVIAVNFVNVAYFDPTYSILPSHMW